MQVTPSTYTVAQYCAAFGEREIVVNNDYQRGRVWPPAARSYLIDTLLSGYPIPKIALFQKTDLRTRKTIHEIVDGQQRSATIYDFYADKLRLSGKGQWSGKRYSDLAEDEQQRFLAYQLSVDLFVAATEADIRQVFRRMNSYTVPLNRQEQRHATFQGDFKWFVIEMSELYSQILKDMGVFTERNLSRMDDAKLLTDLCYTTADGIKSQSENSLDSFYAAGEDGYSEEAEMRDRLGQAISTVLRWPDLHDGPLMRSYAFYSLALAVMHCAHPVDSLQSVFPLDSVISIDDNIVLPNLTLLAEALADPETAPAYSEFVRAAEAATNRIGPRTARFRWFCMALQPRLLHETTSTT
jgi:hypothetical protein